MREQCTKKHSVESIKFWKAELEKLNHDEGKTVLAALHAVS